MNGIMIQGTASHVGKSMTCTAICRLLADEGVRTAPFKSQNMSSFTMDIGGGLRISRAQCVQAEAAKTRPVAEMNPIVLAPADDTAADILLLGRPFGRMDGMEYRERFFRKGLEVIRKSLELIGVQFDAIVIEGAGSPAEVNLNDRELVNMRVAREANVPVLLVADIERGGVFASIIGRMPGRSNGRSIVFHSSGRAARSWRWRRMRLFISSSAGLPVATYMRRPDRWAPSQFSANAVLPLLTPPFTKTSVPRTIRQAPPSEPSSFPAP